MKYKKYQKGNYILWLVINYDPYDLDPDIDEPLKLIDDFDPVFQDRDELKDYYTITYAITDINDNDRYYLFKNRKEAKKFLDKLIGIENPPQNYEEIRTDVMVAKALMENQLWHGQFLENDCYTWDEDWSGILNPKDSMRILKVINWLVKEHENNEKT